MSEAPRCVNHQKDSPAIYCIPGCPLRPHLEARAAMEGLLKDAEERFDNAPIHHQPFRRIELNNQYTAIGQRDRLLQLLKISCKIDAKKP